MTTILARERPGTKKLKTEIIGFGLAGIVFLALSVLWFSVTGFEMKAVAIPVALGLVGVGFAIFGLLAAKNLTKGWTPAQSVVTINDQGVDFVGLGQIPWSSIVMATGAGRYPKNGQMTVGFGAAAFGHGNQAKTHTPIRKLYKQPLKNMLASTYLFIGVKNAPEGLGKDWELGKVIDLAPDYKLIAVSPDIFLDEQNYTMLLTQLEQHMVTQKRLFNNYGNAAAAVVQIANWAGSLAVGVVVNPQTITSGTGNFYTWFSSLNEKEIDDLIVHLNNIVNQPGFLERRIAAGEAVLAKVVEATGREVFADQAYVAALGIRFMDRYLDKDKKNLEVAGAAATLLESVVVAFLAEENHVELDQEAYQCLLLPFVQAGFNPSAPVTNTVPPVTPAPVAPQVPVPPAPTFSAPATMANPAPAPAPAAPALPPSFAPLPPVPKFPSQG